MKPITEMDMAELWMWLREHPYYVLDEIWEALPCALDIHFIHVNPLTKDVDDDATKNTMVECWLEFGSMQNLIDPSTNEPYVRSAHDVELDCSGSSFEEAFRKLCSLILEKVGDYER